MRKGENSMRRSQFGILVLAAVACLYSERSAFASDDESSAVICPSRIGVEASIAPVEGQVGVFRLRATTKDLTSDEPLPSPQILFRQGEGGSAQSSLPGGGEIRFTVSVGQEATAIYQVETLCAGKLTNSQKVIVQLPK
jgi:hypothetical protein